MAHNFVDFEFNRQTDAVAQTQSGFYWPYLEILDLSSNNLTDIEQVSYLFSDNMVNPETIRVISVYDNQLKENHLSVLPSQVVYNVDYLSLISEYSQFTT